MSSPIRVTWLYRDVFMTPWYETRHFSFCHARSDSDRAECSCRSGTVFRLAGGYRDSTHFLDRGGYFSSGLIQSSRTRRCSNPSSPPSLPVLGFFHSSRNATLGFSFEAFCAGNKLAEIAMNTISAVAATSVRGSYGVSP